MLCNLRELTPFNVSVLNEVYNWSFVNRKETLI